MMPFGVEDPDSFWGRNIVGILKSKVSSTVGIFECQFEESELFWIIKSIMKIPDANHGAVFFILCFTYKTGTLMRYM